MKREALSVMNLFRVFNYVQSQAMGSLPRSKNKQVNALSMRQVKAMMIVYLRDAGGKAPMTLGQLGKLLCLKKAATSLLVSDLVDQKLFCRSVDRENRRYIRITLGAKGRNLGDSATALAEKHITRLLGALTDEERKIFTQVAGKIYTRYSQEVGDDK